jgi:hypothetical protein
MRAPGLGAARARAQVTATVESRGGAVRDTDGALLARIPRAALLSVTEELAKQGRYKMTRVEEAALDPSATTVLIRFELE